MAAAFDTGTLSWVRDEIDLALERAGTALARHAAAPADAKPLAEARGLLHQACGALALVGLAGVTGFATSVEARLAALAEKHDTADVVAICATAGTALATLRRYLDDLMAGHPDQPLRLYPAYRALADAAGQPASPLALFHPDLSPHAPPRTDCTPLAPVRRKALRFGFARGLAKWRADEARGLTEMRNAVASIEQSCATAELRNLWWIALAWFEAVADAAPDEALLAGLDRQVEAFAEERAESASDELVAGLLYDIALAPPGDALREAVRSAYRLADLIPTAETVATRREACRAPLATAMEEWERFSQGQAIALMRFHDVALLLVAAARDSNDTELAKLAQDIAEFAAWLRQQPERADAAMMLEMAGALVLVEEGVEQEGVRSPEDESLFADAVATLSERLEAVKQDRAGQPLAGLRWRERQRIGQAAREIRSSLEAIEATLDVYFRSPASPGNAAALPSVLAQLRQIAGVFTMLEETAAGEIAAATAARLETCQPGTGSTEDFAAIADRVATLGEFAAALSRGKPDPSLLESLPHGPGAVLPAPTFSKTDTANETILIGTLAVAPTLYRLYIDEARGHVAMLRKELAGGGTPSRDAIRAAHTLAGISAGTGFADAHALAHALETALARLALARAVPDDAGRMLLARAVGALEGMVGAIAERRAPAAEPALAAALETLQATPAAVAAPQPEAPAPLSPLAERRHSRPADEVDPQLAALFLEEADEQLGQFTADLHAWRAAPNDAAIGRRIARLLHTFKGGARMCGAMGIGELAHGMETRVEEALAGGGATGTVLDSLTASLDRASHLVDELRQPTPSAAASSMPAAPTTPAPVPAPGSTTPVAMSAAAASAGETAAVLLRVRADLIDQLVSEAGEMAISRSRVEGSLKSAKGALLDLTDNVARLRNQLREFEIHAETSMQSRLGGSLITGEGQQRDFDPLEFDRFTRLQELTRMMAESVNDVATVQHALLRQVDVANEALATQSRQNRDLSHALLRARMVPFSTVADRLHRVVRQTAKDLGRQANLDISGGDTPVDRNVLERMLGPLEHLLRNAVAHGIETPERRRAAGKPELGQISLAIVPTDNDITLTLADDGGGLDFAAIRQRAVERGLLAETAPADAAALVDLIFRPGFSTAAAVSEIAGRGVGLDVVRDEVTQLGGRIEVDAQAGQGTHFRIVLPLTLAVIPVMLVTAAGQRWAIPAAMVEEARELDAVEAADRRRAGGIVRDGRDYPWHDLPQLFGMAEPAGQPAWQLLLRGSGTQIALEVEALTQNLEVVVKPVGDLLARVPGLTGATVLPDGAVALIVNPVTLAQRAAPLRPAGTGATEPVAAAAEPAAATPLVMVVDDSLTVRKITGRLLERAGFRVVTAKDGVDALEQIQRARPAVILADIEMPRMDGFELVRELRATPDLADLPVIMITSRIAERHRQVARELGVRHYLGKPYDETALLALLAELTKT